MNFSENHHTYYNIILWKKNGSIKKYIIRFLNFEFLDQDFDYVMFLDFDLCHALANHNLKDILESLQKIYNDDQNTIVVLTNRKELPMRTQRAGEFVNSFSCGFYHFKNIIDKYNRSEFFGKDLLFTILDQIFIGNSDFKKILVRQIPLQIEQASPINNCDVIIPHRGENSFLKNLLFFLDQLNHLHIYAGIDQDLTQEILMLRKKHPNIDFFNFEPNPMGPYVVRNYLIDKSKNDLIFFQDSDDIPCADRFEKISNYMNTTGCQLCGSHELRVDYFDKTVRAYRFPINAKGALKTGPWHPLLHPSSAITREAFYLCERLSEERTFGNDTKFLLHSFFLLDSIHNINEFLYIRRYRPNSLTTSPETMIGSPIRKKLLHTWNKDFELIKDGELSLENSSLNYEGSKIKFEVKKL